MVLILAILHFLVCLVPFFRKHNGTVFFFRADVFISLISMFYVLPVPLDFYFADRPQFLVNYDTLITMQLTFLLFQLFFVIGFHLALKRKGLSPVISKEKASFNTFSYGVAILLISISLLIYYLYLRKVGGFLALMLSDRFEFMEVSNENGFYGIGLLMLKTGLLMLLAKLLIARKVTRKWNRIMLLTAVSLLLFYIPVNVLVGDRRVLAGLMLGVLCIFLMTRKKQVNALKMFIIMLPFIFIMHFISKVRHLTYDPALMVTSMVKDFDIGWLNLANSEFLGHYIVFADVVENMETVGYQYGKTYAYTPILIAPKFIWPGRTFNGMSEWYVKTFDYDTWLKGGGYAFTYPGESYMNFWLFGPVLIGFVTGFGLRKWWLYTMVNKTNAFKIALYALSLSMLLALYRTEFSYIIKEFFLSAFLPILLVYAYKLTRHKKVAPAKTETTLSMG